MRRCPWHYLRPAEQVLVVAVIKKGGMRSPRVWSRWAVSTPRLHVSGPVAVVVVVGMGYSASAFETWKNGEVLCWCCKSKRGRTTRQHYHHQHHHPARGHT